MKIFNRTILFLARLTGLGFLVLIPMGCSTLPLVKSGSANPEATVQALVTQLVAGLTQTPPMVDASTPPPSVVEPAAQQSAPNLTLAMLQNAQYHSGTWGDYQLVNGIFYRTPPTAGESPELYSTELYMPAFGDLNMDGLEDAVVILRTQNGGNGNNKELAVVLDRSGTAYNVSTFDAGMVAVDAVQIQSGMISLNVRTLAPNDGLCCPSQQETWRFRLENDQLVRLP